MAIGFKEWALVCDAMGAGEQSIILRKGGIHEGRAGFQFQHDEFFLFPTLFHEQVARTKLSGETPLPVREEGMIEVRYLVRVEWTARIEEWPAAQALAPFHIWTEAEIESRFRYENAGLNLAFVRVSKLAEPWRFPDEPKYGGCRSWVNLPEPPAIGASAVLDEKIHREREREILAVIPSAVESRVCETAAGDRRGKSRWVSGNGERHFGLHGSPTGSLDCARDDR